MLNDYNLLYIFAKQFAQIFTLSGNIFVDNQPRFLLFFREARRKSNAFSLVTKKICKSMYLLILNLFLFLDHNFLQLLMQW